MNEFLIAVGVFLLVAAYAIQLGIWMDEAEHEGRKRR